MKVILANDDADRLDTLLRDRGQAPAIEVITPRAATIVVAGERFHARAGRPTPGDPGSVQVEDMDGRVLFGMRLESG